MSLLVSSLAVGFLAFVTVPQQQDAQTQELKSLKGKWIAIKVEGAGKSVPKAELERLQVSWTFENDGKAIFAAEGKTAQYTYRIDSTKTPKQIDLTYAGNVKGFEKKQQFGIYKIEKGVLTLCLSNFGVEEKGNRPSEFNVQPPANILLTLKRAEKK